MTLQRHPGTYITYAIAPMFLMVVLASLSSWIEISAGETSNLDSDRIGYTATILLTEMATMLFFNEKRAMSGLDTWLDNYQCTCVVLTVIPLLETFLVLYLMRHRVEIKQMYQKFFGRVQNEEQSDDEASDVQSFLVADEKRTMTWYDEPGIVVDTYFRNLYPFVVVCAMAHLYSKVSGNGQSSFGLLGSLDNFASDQKSMALMGALTVSVQFGLLLVALFFIIGRLQLRLCSQHNE